MDRLTALATDALARAQTIDWHREASRVADALRSTSAREAAWAACGLLGAASLTTYYVPATYHKLFHGVQNLKRKYGAEWGLVTGGSSGIGLAMVKRLASQGCNVVVAAYPDKTLDQAVDALQREFPAVQFLKVPVNLGKPEAVPELFKATEHLTIQIVFNNAGYITTGFFTDVSLERQITNHHCNATAALQITHHYVSLLQKRKLRGCVGFTSSPAGYMPCPFSVVYGATKAYLTEFALSIAPELYPDGIDVCVVHPSPVATSFYEGAHAIGALVFFKSTATGPQRISDAIFASMGRTVVREQGYYPFSVRLITKLIDLNFLGDVMTATARFMPEFKTLKGVAAPAKGA